MNHLRKLLVDNGVISQETADLWSEMYPHYVPIRRLGDIGLARNARGAQGKLCRHGGEYDWGAQAHHRVSRRKRTSSYIHRHAQSRDYQEGRHL